MPLLPIMGCGGGSSSGVPVDEDHPLCTAADPGPAPLRRLTRFELGRALADTLGVDPSLADGLPPDEVSLGYDNNAHAYSVSAAHVTKTLEMAEAAAAAATADPRTLRDLAGCDALDTAQHATCVPALLQALGPRLWRRPVQDDELTDLVSLAAAQEDARAGVTAALAVMLQAPDFLYRPEPPPPGAAAAPLAADALATRLAFLITNAPPDDALLASARDGVLATPQGLQAQAERLLAAPRALQSFQRFVTQWWELGDLPAVQKDTNLYRTWTPSIPGEFATETALFLGGAWSKGPTLHRLLRDPTTYLDGPLAAFYGIDPGTVVAPGFQPVSLDPLRASGLLTQGSFLATHAKADQTSPILRGKFVRAQLFCRPPPPPPPNVVITPPSVNPRLSTRERFQQHTADPFCASCHTLMDPIGFAFEQFDAVGRWRTTDGGKPVDAAGQLTGTDVDGALSGAVELGERLADSAQVRACVATQWFRWAFGRDQETSDDLCTVGALASALAQARGDLRALPRFTITTSTFLTIRGAEAP